jgi:hypothetical protein
VLLKSQTQAGNLPAGRLGREEREGDGKNTYVQLSDFLPTLPSYRHFYKTHILFNEFNT